MQPLDASGRMVMPDRGRVIFLFSERTCSMEPIKPTAGLASLPLNAQQCPLCGKPVTPEMWGLVECSCGRGGPDDPLEAARGVTKLAIRLDRRLATQTAKRDLRRLASGQWRPGR